jgi:hypothetical protein
VIPGFSPADRIGKKRCPLDQSLWYLFCAHKYLGDGTVSGQNDAISQTLLTLRVAGGHKLSKLDRVIMNRHNVHTLDDEMDDFANNSMVLPVEKVVDQIISTI